MGERERQRRWGLRAEQTRKVPLVAPVFPLVKAGEYRLRTECECQESWRKVSEDTLGSLLETEVRTSERSTVPG